MHRVHTCIAYGVFLILYTVIHATCQYPNLTKTSLTEKINMFESLKFYSCKNILQNTMVRVSNSNMLILSALKFWLGTVCPSAPSPYLFKGKKHEYLSKLRSGPTLGSHFHPTSETLCSETSTSAVETTATFAAGNSTNPVNPFVLFKTQHCLQKFVRQQK